MEQGVATTETTSSERALGAVTHSTSPLQAPDSQDSQTQDQNAAQSQETDRDEQLAQTVVQVDLRHAKETEVHSRSDDTESERACQNIEHNDDNHYQKDAQISSDAAETETAETQSERQGTPVVDTSEPAGEKDKTLEEVAEGVSALVQQEHSFAPENTSSDSCQQASSHQLSVHPASSASQSIPETDDNHHRTQPVSITSKNDWSAAAASLTASDRSLCLDPAGVEHSESASMCTVSLSQTNPDSFSENHPEWSAAHSERYALSEGTGHRQQELMSESRHASETVSFLESLADQAVEYPTAPQSRNTWPASLTSLDTLAQGNGLKGLGEQNNQVYHSAPASCRYSEPHQLPPAEPPQLPPGRFMSPPLAPPNCPVSLPDLLGVSPENAMQRFVQEPSGNTSQSFNCGTVMSGPPSDPMMLQPPMMLSHLRSDSVMPHHSYDAMQHTTVMSHPDTTAPYSSVDGFAASYPALTKTGSLAAMLPPLSTMMPQSNTVDTMMPYHKQDITPHYQNFDTVMSPPLQPPQPPIQHHDILSAAVAHTIGLPQDQDQGQDPETYPPPLVHPPDNPYPPMLALPEEHNRTPLKGPAVQNFSPPFPPPYSFRGFPHSSPQTYQPRPRRTPRRSTPRMRTPVRRGGPRRRTSSTQCDPLSDLDLSDFSPGHWAHLETDPDEPIILEIDPSQRPKSLLQAINMYIDFLIWENQKKVKIDEDRIIPMPCDFDSEEYYLNVMSKPTPFPTAKLRSWLKLYNVDIEITDPEGNVMKETTFAPVMTTSSPVTPITAPVTRDSNCDDSNTTRYVMHWYMNDQRRGAGGNTEMGVPGVEGPLASGPAVFGNCGVCSPPLRQVTGAQPYGTSSRNPEEQNTGRRSGVVAQGFAQEKDTVPRFNPRSAMHQPRYSVGMQPSRKHSISQVSHPSRGHRRGRWHSSRFSREVPSQTQITAMQKTPQSQAPIGQPAVTHWAPICTPRSTAGVSKSPDLDVVTVYPSDYLGSRVRGRGSTKPESIQEISSDGPNKVYILKKKKVSQGSQTERSYTVAVKRMKLAQGQRGHPEGRVPPQGPNNHPRGNVRQEPTPNEEPGPCKSFPQPLCSSTPLKEMEVRRFDFDKEIGQKEKKREDLERKEKDNQLEVEPSEDAEPIDVETIQMSGNSTEDVDIMTAADADNKTSKKTQPDEEEEVKKKEEATEVPAVVNTKDNAEHCTDHKKLSRKAAETDQSSILKSLEKNEPKVTRSTTAGSKQMILEPVRATRSVEGNLHKDNSDCSSKSVLSRCLTRSESAHSLVSSRGVPEVRITRLCDFTTQGITLSADQLRILKSQKPLRLDETKQKNEKHTSRESEDVELAQGSETRKRPKTRLTGLESPPKKIRRSQRLCTGSTGN